MRCGISIVLCVVRVVADRCSLGEGCAANEGPAVVGLRSVDDRLHISGYIDYDGLGNRDIGTAERRDRAKSVS